MLKARMRRRLGVCSVLCGTLLAVDGCFSAELIGQVFADQVAFTASTLARAIFDGMFGVVFP